MTKSTSVAEKLALVLLVYRTKKKKKAYIVYNLSTWKIPVNILKN